MTTVGQIITLTFGPLELNPGETSKLGGQSEDSACLNEGAWCEDSASYRGSSQSRGPGGVHCQSCESTHRNCQMFREINGRRGYSG